MVQPKKKRTNRADACQNHDHSGASNPIGQGAHRKRRYEAGQVESRADISSESGCANGAGPFQTRHAVMKAGVQAHIPISSQQ